MIAIVSPRWRCHSLRRGNAALQLNEDDMRWVGIEVEKQLFKKLRILKAAGKHFESFSFLLLERKNHLGQSWASMVQFQFHQNRLSVGPGPHLQRSIPANTEAVSNQHLSIFFSLQRAENITGVRAQTHVNFLTACGRHARPTTHKEYGRALESCR